MLPQATVRKLFTRLKKRNPEPRSELVYRSHFELLVAVILSAQATDVSVNKATKTLFREANTPAKMLKLGKRKLKATSRPSACSTPRPTTFSPPANSCWTNTAGACRTAATR